MASVKEPISQVRHDDVDLARDRSLVERCQAGDERAFEDLYLRYRDRLYRSCLRRTHNVSEAEDLVQETFARAWKALPRFNGERRFYPWLSVIANNLCTDLARRGGRCTPVEESDLDLIAPVVPSEQDSLVEASGDGQILAAALGRISARHREVLELREGRNWSYQQIASHAGVEVSTIETLLFRARRSLKREFLTIARAETGLAGVLAFPLVAMRGLWRRARHGLRHSAPGAKLAAAASAMPVAPVVGGVAVAVTAAALAAGAVLGTHVHGLPAASASRPALAGSLGHAVPRSSGFGATGGGGSALRHQAAATSRHHRAAHSRHGGARVGTLPRGTTSVAGGAGSALGGTSAGGGTAAGVISGAGSVLGKVTGTLGGGSSPLNGVGSSLGGTVSSGVSQISSGVSQVSTGVSEIGGGLP